MFVAKEQLVKLPTTRQCVLVLVDTLATPSSAAGGLRRRTCALPILADLEPTASLASTGQVLTARCVRALRGGGETL